MNRNSFFSAKLAIAATGLLFASQAVLACTTDNWSNVGGNVSVGDPAADGIPRYSGICAMQVETGSVGFVQDDSPGGIDRIVARFYVLADTDSDGVIYRGLGSGGATLFDVELDSTGTVTLESGGATATGQGQPGSWNSIELDWNAADGNMSLVVNGGEGDTTSFSSAGDLQSVRLGYVNGAGSPGTLTFDAYESRRSTEVGRLLVGDATPDGSVGITDVVATLNEAVGVTADSLASGQPDCNEDGDVGIADVICVLNVAVGG